MTGPAPRRSARLHRRASRWFAANGLVDEALEHALSADDPESAADIIEQHRVRTLNADQWPVLAGWLARLPEEIVWQRPELLLGEAWFAYYRFRIPALARIVERLDELLRRGWRPPGVGRGTRHVQVLPVLLAGRGAGDARRTSPRLRIYCRSRTI